MIRCNLCGKVFVSARFLEKYRDAKHAAQAPAPIVMPAPPAHHLRNQADIAKEQEYLKNLKHRMAQGKGYELWIDPVYSFRRNQEKKAREEQAQQQQQFARDFENMELDNR